MERTPIRLILNGAAAAAESVRSRLASLLADTGCQIQSTRGPGDAERWARQARTDGIRRLLIAGGDGTVHQVVNGLGPEFGDLELAVIPLGTGNDLARSLGVPLDDLRRAVELALHGEARAVDVVSVTGDTTSYLINAASAGFGGRVAADVATADKLNWGAFAYWMTAISNLVDMQQFDVHLELDGQSESLLVYGIFIANGRFVGGGFPIAPHAMLDDGFMHITVVPVLPPVELLSSGLNFAISQAEEGTDSPVSCRPRRRVRVTTSPEMLFSIDGEPVRRIDATFEIIPGALRFVAAPSAPAFQRGTGNG